MDNNRKVWVIGHKNPDTDSVCSAICYAALKNKLEGNRFEAKRAGNINQETAFVLKYFGVEEPELVEDVSTQVKDVEWRRMEGITTDTSIRKAWQRMQDVGVETVPVVRKKKLVGLVTLKDIAGAYLDEDNRGLARAHTTVKNIIETIDGKLIVGDIKDVCPDGKVLVAASAPEVMESFIEKNDIVLVGNRYEVQLCALEMNAGMIIACCGATVSATVKKMAEEKGCILIGTKNDTYTVSHLINQSIPAEQIMTGKNLVTFTPDDLMEEVAETMARLRHRYFPIIDHSGYYLGMLSRRNLLGMKPKQLILVDHNEKSQACDGIENAEILEIIDHHRIGTISTFSPIYFRNQPVGCTATIIYKMYMEEKIPIDKVTAGLLCSAIISDTLLFRSPTCTIRDRQAAEKLALIAQINPEKYANEMFIAGSDFSSKSAEQIFRQDYKEFAAGEHLLGVAQINCMSRELLDGIRDRMKKYMATAVKKQSTDLLFFIMTSIPDEDSEILAAGAGAQEALEKAFGIPAGTDKILIKGLVSRKKQFIPSVTGVL